MYAKFVSYVFFFLFGGYEHLRKQGLTGGSRLMGWILSCLLSWHFLLLSQCSVGHDVKSCPLLLTPVAMVCMGSSNQGLNPLKP